MDWFYAQQGKQVGPVSSEKFQQLVREGVITPETLIWREGMSEWQAYQKLRQSIGGAPPPVAAGMVVCAECGQAVAQGEAIHFNNLWVCGQCKPVFFQRLKEGVQAGASLLWRSGKVLVAKHDAVLPDRCVKCNAPATRRLPRKLYWHHPAVFLLILCSILIYLVVAIIVRKRANIDIGLCQAHFERRKRDILISWVAALLGIGMIVAAVMYESGLAGVGGAVVLIGSLVYAAVVTPMVSPKRIDREQVFLKGACKEFLEGLPEWTGPS